MSGGGVMNWDPFEFFDEGFLIVDEEQDERRRTRLEKDTFTLDPDEGFEEREAWDEAEE